MGIEFATKYKQGDALQTVQLPYRRAQDSNDGYFTSDFVIAFARLRINQLNASLNRRLETMQAGARDSEAVNKCLKEIALYSEGFDDPTKKEALKEAFRKIAGELPEGQLRDRLYSYANDPNSYLSLGNNDNRVTKEDLAALQKDLELTLKSIDRRCQDDQLYVNKEMGEKDQVLQLAAMLIQSMNESIKQIMGRS